MNGRSSRFTFHTSPFVISLFFLFLALLPACSRNGDNPPPDPTPDLNALHLRTFDTLWVTINDNYVYSDFPGVDWQGVHDEYRPQVEAGLSREAFVALLEEVLAELPEGATAVLQTRDERLEAAQADTSSYEGIGAYVAVRGNDEEPRVLLLSIMNGSPAQTAGLTPHTSVLAINGIPIAVGDSQEDVVSQVRGPAGSDVTLTVREPGGEPYDVVVTRDRVQLGNITPIEGGRLGGEQNIAYFLFPPVPYQGMDQDLVAGLSELSQTDALDGIILDLRIATLDDQWPLTSLLGLFGNGELGEFYTRDDTTPVDLEGEDILDSQNIPLAIIVSPETSGIPEIFAAALQASGRAIIVGKTTSGQLELVSTYFLPDGSQLFVPTRSFRTSNDQEIGLLGIEPDVVVNLDWDAVTFTDDPVREAAVEALLNG